MRLKRISEILSRLIDTTLVNTDEINDFTPGSVIRSIYESFAMELEQFYMLTRENILWGIENGVLNAFGFYRREARKAYGYVTIEFYTTTQSDIYIPRGTAFSSTDRQLQQQYELLEDVIIPKGAITYDVEVFCSKPGSIGNVEAETINLMLSSLSNVKRVRNKEDIITGQDAEPYEELRNRFQAFIETRGRATVKALDYGTRQVPDVSGVYVHEMVGLVELYVHDKNGNLPDSLRTAVIEAIEDYRPAGIKLEVFPVIKRSVDLEVDVYLSDKLKETEALKDEIVSTLRAHLNLKEVSQDLILADIIRIVMSVDEYLIQDCDIVNIDSNIEVESSELIRAGAVLVNFR